MWETSAILFTYVVCVLVRVLHTPLHSGELYGATASLR